MNGAYYRTCNGEFRARVDHPSQRLLLVESNGSSAIVYGLDQVAYRHNGQCNVLFVDGSAGIMPDEAKTSKNNVYWGNWRSTRDFDDYLYDPNSGMVYE